MNDNLDIVNNPLLHIVLDRPKIAANIAAIVRTCVATKCALHVCGPLVFKTSDKTKWRAGLDYFHGARVHFHQNIKNCLSLLQKDPWLIEVGGSQTLWQTPLTVGDVVVFGPEDSNISEYLCKEFKERIVNIPTPGPVRSLNLALCCGLVSFEALRQNEI